MDVPLGNVLALPAPLLDGALPIGHALAVPRHFVFLRAPTVFFGPRRWRALVFVRCPRTGRLRRCRMPRYDPISMRRLMFSATSRRRSPSTLKLRSMTSRSRLTWSSVRSRTRVSGLMLVCFRIFWLERQPDPVDVGKGDLDALLARDVDAGDTCHRVSPAAACAWGFADDHHGAVAPDDLAVVAPRLDGRSDLHQVLDLSYFRRYVIRPRVRS